MTFDQLEKIARAVGFEAVAPLDIKNLQLRNEVRDMCAGNSCGKYAKCWSCPPGCGTLEECRVRVQARAFGILVQTVGEIEDSFDGEGMMAAESAHKRRMLTLQTALTGMGCAPLALGAGCCTRCAECTYPDSPCRFPDGMISSMEAYGLLVSQVCGDNDLKYYYGSDRIAYTGCFLI